MLEYGFADGVARERAEGEGLKCVGASCCCCCCCCQCVALGGSVTACHECEERPDEGSSRGDGACCSNGTEGCCIGSCWRPWREVTAKGGRWGG